MLPPFISSRDKQKSGDPEQTGIIRMVFLTIFYKSSAGGQDVKYPAMVGKYHFAGAYTLKCFHEVKIAL